MLGRGAVVGALLLLVAIIYVPPTLEPPSGTQSWLMFDGVCNLCNGFINLVADYDSQHNIKFGAQQKHMELLEQRGAPTDLSTIVLIQGDKYYLYSTSVLRAFAMMDQPWRSVSVAIIIPEFIRDTVYGLVARNRYWMFGKSEKCRTPTSDFKARFIDYDAKADPDNHFVQQIIRPATPDEL